jgi:hypothetical protein
MNISLAFVEQLDQPTREALERLAAEIVTGWAVDHNADGTHKHPPNGGNGGGGGGSGDVVGPAGATDLHIAVYDGTTGKLIADGGTTIAALVALAGAVGAHHATHEPGGSDALGNAAWTFLHNTFTQSQTIAASGGPRVIYTETDGPANARTFHHMNFGSGMRLWSYTDGGALIAQAHEVDTVGNTYIAGKMHERSRTTAMGDWQNGAYLAGNYTCAPTGTWTVEAGDQVTLQYMLVGKTLFLNVALINTATTDAAAELRMVIPGGYQAVTHATALCQSYSTPQEVVVIVVNANATFLSFQRQNGAVWGTGPCTLRGQVFFQVY